MISLPYFFWHTQKAVASVPHKKSLGLIALTCLCFEEPLSCAGLVFNVSQLEAAYSCSSLLPRRNQLSLWLDSTQNLTTQFILKSSSTVQSLNMYQSLVCTPGTCQLLQPAPRLTDLAQCYSPSYFLMWKVQGAGGWLKFQQRWFLEVRSSFRFYITVIIPSMMHIIWLTEENSVMDLKTEHANLFISMTPEPHEKVNICLEDLHLNAHVSSNPFYTFVDITAQNWNQLFISLIKSAMLAWLLSGWGQFSVSCICINSKAEQCEWLHLIVNKWKPSYSFSYLPFISMQWVLLWVLTTETNSFICLMRV